MKPEFASSKLRCPFCRHDRTLRLFAVESDQREVRTGTLTCKHCGGQRPVYRGVGDLMVNAPEFVERESAGLERFAQRMRDDGWSPETIRQLPDRDDGYWYVQGASINQVAREVPFQPGQSLLDIGSNTCWASNFFAVRGLDVTALDISLWELQGLWTADYFIEEDISYFERVRGSMTDMPLASDSFDYVYACEVLHHNDADALHRAFEEAYRVLKPGGRMIVVNETLKTLHDPVGVHAEAVAEYEGHEHAHWAAQYRWGAIRAGFSTRLLEPSYHGFYRAPPPPDPPPLRRWQARIEHELRRRPWGRRLFLSWINNVAGGTAFGMIATKPYRPRTPRAAVAAVTGLPRRAVRSG
jgi:SAM-dependent methyltransferase/uncharacterized protein YbaR (Trm112 family)